MSVLMRALVAIIGLDRRYSRKKANGVERALAAKTAETGNIGVVNRLRPIESIDDIIATAHDSLRQLA